MPSLVNRGFTVTLVAIAIAAELALRAAAMAPPNVVRITYGTTLAMYMEVAHRLREAAPGVRVLALGDSLPMTQFQPGVFAADHGLAPTAVFNASYLAMTYRSESQLLTTVGIDRFTQLRRVVMFVNPRRLTPEGNTESDVFDEASPYRSRLYGLSRYLVTASWRQWGRPVSWDQVEFLGPHGGVAFDQPRPSNSVPVFLYEPIDALSESYVADLRAVIARFRERQVDVVLLPSPHHPSAQPFASSAAADRFNARMLSLAEETGSRWVPIPAGDFQPPADTDYLDYGHLNRSGGEAFTHYLRGALAGLPPID